MSADYRIDVRGVTRWYEGLVTPVGDADGDGGRVLLTARGITERKDREHRLVDARDQLRQTLERVSDGFFAITTDWEVTYVNSSGDDVLRRVMHVDDDGLDLVGENLLDHAPEAVESRFYDEFTRSMETQTPVTIEDRYDPIDGWFSVNAYPSESGLSVYFSDISERKRREQGWS
ncbi:PAS domain-containing protein [Halobaculum litoreum]|uniref:PAS domain-containing protein n=1 Tax=Halobaculum litoreum TaxID=3031998 RepID=A0ABD5XRX6_9EURY